MTRSVTMALRDLMAHNQGISQHSTYKTGGSSPEAHGMARCRVGVLPHNHTFHLRHEIYSEAPVCAWHVQSLHACCLYAEAQLTRKKGSMCICATC
jgi:hypothetical protein